MQVCFLTVCMEALVHSWHPLFYWLPDVPAVLWFLLQRLGTCHTHATKNPDPFHQLYEQRKGKLSVVQTIGNYWRRVWCRTAIKLGEVCCPRLRNFFVDVFIKASYFYAFSLCVVLMCYTCTGVIWNNFAVDGKYHKELIVSGSLSGSWLTVSWSKGQRVWELFVTMRH